VSQHPTDALPRTGAFEPDPELLALPAPPKRERALTVALMAMTALAAVVVAWTLRGEASYALASGEPTDVGDLALFAAGAPHENSYVRGVGNLASTGAIKYGRAAEGDSFRLAPIAGNERIWVEIRVPEGFEGPRFIPPSSFAGRLVPFDRSGLRHASLASAVEDQTGSKVPEGSWILVDGTSPRASRWALALATLFLGFAVWNTVSAVRLVARVRDEADEERDAA
jgi:hypothetical protein